MWVSCSKSQTGLTDELGLDAWWSWQLGWSVLDNAVQEELNIEASAGQRRTVPKICPVSSSINQRQRKEQDQS